MSQSEERLREIAERRVDAKRGFRGHAMVYAMVNAGLATLNLLTSPGHLWFMFPLVGWGIGLAAHGISVYGSSPHDCEAEIARELERLRRGRGAP